MPRGIRLTRVGHIAFLVLFVVVLLGARLFYLQIVRFPEYREQSIRQVDSVLEIPARRGRILDRKHRPLAFDVVAYDVSILRKHFRRRDLDQVSLALDMPSAELKRLLTAGRSYVPVAKQVALSPATVKQLSRLPGLAVDRRNARQYPFGTLAAQYIGLLNAEGRGVAGVEQTYDKMLRGQPGRTKLLKDEEGNPIGRLASQDPVDGVDLVLALDLDLQRIAEAHLQQALEESNAKSGSILIMDPDNGDILACANGPLPESREGEFVDSQWTNHAVYDVFEPGSTLKVVTASAALRYGVANFSTFIHAEHGVKRFGRAGTIHDSHRGYEWLSFQEAFAKSSNVCFAKTAQRLTSAQFYEELRAFGLGTKTGASFLDEPRGMLALPRDWSGRTRLTLGIGQEICVTAVQLANLFSTVANGGVLHRPRVAIQMRAHSGVHYQDLGVKAVRRVMSQEHAQALGELCAAVVSDGTGVKAALDGVPIAGKTGTAEKAKDGRYVEEYVASFAGFVPAEDPQLVILVVVDEPDWAHHYGGTSAAPAFRGVVESILRTTDYLDPAVEQVQVVRGDDLKQRPTALKAPFRLATWKKDTVPDLRGFTLRIAANWLQRMGLEAEAQGRGFVRQQWPAPGDRFAEGDAVRLLCEPESAPSRRATILNP